MELFFKGGQYCLKWQPSPALWSNIEEFENSAQIVFCILTIMYFYLHVLYHLKFNLKPKSAGLNVFQRLLLTPLLKR